MKKGYDVRISVYETSRGFKLGTISFLYEVAQALSSTDYIDIYVEDGRLYFEESTSLSGCKISRGKVQFQAVRLIDLVEPYSGLVYDIVKDVSFSGTRHYVELKEGRDGSTNNPSRLGIAKNNPCINV